jgi:hypothetical protein
VTCLPDTRSDVLAQIRSWADGGGNKHIDWLKGWVGTGKSTISLTVAREDKNKKRLGAACNSLARRYRRRGPRPSLVTFAALVASLGVGRLSISSPTGKCRQVRVLRTSVTLTTRPPRANRGCWECRNWLILLQRLVIVGSSVDTFAYYHLACQTVVVKLKTRCTTRLCRGWRVGIKTFNSQL